MFKWILLLYLPAQRCQTVAICHLALALARTRIRRTSYFLHTTCCLQQQQQQHAPIHSHTHNTHTQLEQQPRTSRGTNIDALSATMHTYTPANSHAYTHTLTHTPIHACVYLRLTSIHTHMCNCICAYE